MEIVGETAIWIALLMSGWAFVVCTVGQARERADLIASADRALHVVFAMLAIAAGVLLRALTSHDFTFRYVSAHTSVNLPSPYPVAAFWAGPEGALLAGALILSAAAFFSIVAERTRVRSTEVALVAMFLTFLIACLSIAFDPLTRLDWVPVDGFGMHPALQSPGAFLYPPLLLAACALLVIPGAAALAAVAGRSIGNEDVDRIARWTAVSWLFNTLGILAGIWWVYHEPDRARHWLAFPLESGALLPWATSATFLLAARRRSSGGWILALPIAGMLVALPAAVLTLAALGPRSGEVSRSPFFAALLAVLALSVAAICALVRSRIGKLERTIPGGRTYALVLVALAVAMITAAAVGRVFRSETAVALRVATPVEVTDALGARWTFASQGLSSYNEANRMVTALALDLARDGEPGGIMSTEIRQYVDVQGAPVFRPAKEAAIRSSLREDVYVVLRDIERDDSAMLTVAFHPLMAWLWVGGCLLALSGMLYTWPARSETEA